MNRTMVGLDIGARHVAAAKVRVAGARFEVLEAARWERCEPGQPLSTLEAQRVMDVLARRGMSEAEIVVALPPARQISAVMELPARGTGAPVDLLARDELARLNRCEAATLQCANWDLPAAGRGRAGAETGAVMAVGCVTTEVASFVEPLIDAGADVAAVDARGPALCRGAGLMRGGVGSPVLTMALDIEDDGAVLVVLVDRVVVYERALPEARLEALVQRVGKRLGLSADDAGLVLETCTVERAQGGGAVRMAIAEYADDVAREVGISVGYAAQRFPQAASDKARPALVLTGRGGEVPLLPARLSERLTFEAKPPEGVLPGVAAAVGLALHGAPGGVVEVRR